MCHFLRVLYKGCGHHVTLNSIFPCSRLSVYNCDLDQWFPGWDNLNSIAARHVYMCEVGACCLICTGQYVSDRLSHTWSDDGYMNYSLSEYPSGRSTLSGGAYRGLPGNGDSEGPPSTVSYWNRLRDDLVPRSSTTSSHTIEDVDVTTHRPHYVQMEVRDGPEYYNIHMEAGPNTAPVADTPSLDLRCRVATCGKKVRWTTKSAETGPLCFKHKWLKWNWRP